MNTEDVFSRPLVSVRFLATVLGYPPDALRHVGKVAQHLYSPFVKVQIRDGRTKHRKIDNPQDLLKDVQAAIKRRMLDKVSLPSCMFGGIKGRSAVGNARVHLGQREVVKFDIKNFFPSVRSTQVADVWITHFHAYGEVLWLLTRLTTRDDRLPQGSPASTSLANLVLLPLIDELDTLCESRGLRLSAYIDDVTVSGMNARDSLSEIIGAFARHGFRLARSKTQVQPSSERQSVTGYVVNRILSVSRNRRISIRNELLGLRGRKLSATELNRAHGLISNVTAANPTQARALLQMLDQLTTRSGAPKLLDAAGPIS